MSTCKKCKANITWKETGRGYRPLNNDGSPHFKTCLYPDQRVVKSGKFRSSDPIQIGKDEYI